MYKAPAYNTNSEDEFTTKEKIQYTLLGVVVLGGSFFIGRNIVRQARANAEEKKTYEDGTPATFAKQIKMAFENDNPFGWGTDEEVIRKAVIAIPSKDSFRKVINSYQKLYARSLMADMQDELATSEYNEMLAIIAAKPERDGGARIEDSGLFVSWAKRLKAAFDISYGPFPGTDEDAIKAVFMEIPSQAAYNQVSIAYGKEYGTSLKEDLENELEFWEYTPMMNIIKSKPKV
jgi:hypothetical protein